ncbi:MAG: hypothetical protein WC658_05690, partial [Candidatus Omnitrophota bacterium]
MKYKLIQFISVIIIATFALQGLAWGQARLPSAVGQAKGEGVSTGVETSPTPPSPGQKSWLRPPAAANRKRHSLRLAFLLHDFFQESVPYKLETWQETKTWLMDNVERATEASNAKLAGSGRRSRTSHARLPYSSLAVALFEAGKTPHNWSRYASVMDLRMRLEDFFRAKIPREGIRNWKEAEKWLLKHRDEAIRVNNEALKRSGEKAEKILSYEELTRALYEAGVTSHSWSWEAGMMDLTH